MPTRLTASNRVGIEEIYVDTVSLLDTTPDYFEISTQPTGAANGKVFTLSLWFKRANAPTSNEVLFAVQGRHLVTLKNVGDNLSIEFESEANADVILADTSTQFSDTNWHHLLVSCDVSDTAKRHAYIDGVEETMTWTTYDNTEIDWTRASYSIGSETGGATPYGGCMSEFYLALEYIDLSAASNLAKFINASGKPVDLGSDGSTPTGNAPLFYLNKAGAAFGTDQSGNSNDLTAGGAPTVCSTSPSD